MDDFRQKLEQLKSEITSLLESSEDDHQPVELDQARQGRLSRMDALQQQEMAKDALRRRQHELIRIEAALERIDKDEYGECLNCGEEISRKRLELDPAATLCIDCARR